MLQKQLNYFKYIFNRLKINDLDVYVFKVLL